MAQVTRASKIQKSFDEGGLTDVFVDQLGWEVPSEAVPSIQLESESFEPELISSLKGFRIYRVPCETRPNRQTMRQVDSALSELSPERLEVFQGPDAWFWHWPRRTNAGTITFESVETAPDALPTFLAQRLTGLQFSIADLRGGITLVDVRDRVHGNFDATNVTTKFYKRFQSEHEGLAKAIVGIPEAAKSSYSTTLLNRLMFIYFMQKKEFLNNDPRYLENTLAAIQKLQGRNEYFTFYRDALLPLFFEKLNSSGVVAGNAEVHAILGDVPYVNGGIFGQTELEEEYCEQLAVPDSAFESILRFFGEFNWHLDTRPTGNPDEINPEVVGYIFEQYINFATSGKKESGAYYTPHDVTAHMVAQTLVPRILDEFSELDKALALLRDDPDRYIQPAMLHGWDASANEWVTAPAHLVEVWESDPVNWPTLDSAVADDEINLPDESWVETFHRRARVESLRARIHNRDVASVNALITENLNAQLMLTDAIDLLNTGDSIVGLFQRITDISVFDPTCGSGAFLFAALEVLEDVYAHIIDAARVNPGDNHGIAGMLAQVDAQPSTPYFIRKHIAIRNLYGTDLMPGAIETAKLRIFLSLAACVEDRAELQPLPDLDFNLKVGNLIVGFKDSADVSRVGADLFTAARLDALEPQIDEYAALYASFVDSVETVDARLVAEKAHLHAREHALRAECNEIYAEATGIARDKLEEWVEVARPFHWFCEFPSVIERGGFDVVIGNPPYVRMTQLPGYTAVGYRSAGCPDLFAVCFERSLDLLSPTGRHAFIVMAALAVSEDYRPLREVIGRRSSAEWWSTFGRIPAGLFPGNVRVRNTLLVLGPGGGVQTTRHHLHKRRQRSWLFPTIEFAASSREGGSWPVRGGVATRMLERLAKLPPITRPSHGEVVYVRPTGAYWFPVLPGSAPVLDADGNVLEDIDRRLTKLHLQPRERVDDVVATLGAKLTYIWWILVGDDFDVNAREADVPRALALKAAEHPGWDSAVRVVLDAVPAAVFVSVNAKKYYFNVRWNNLRQSTDQLDKIAIQAIGGDDLDWRALNILYRQVMRSSGDSSKGRYVTEDELVSILGW